MSVDKDTKTIELLDLLDRYQLLTASNRENFINGFFNLSRANFQNEKTRYGPETFDLRSYKACKVVEQTNDGAFFVIDRLEKGLAKEDKEGKTVRNRKEKSGGEEKAKLEYRDPIKQFGALVPLDLRQSQADFNKAVLQSVEIVNLQVRIEKLINELS
ncbi:hypothetical protein Cantr_01744 [Candida viswanathii]|uniref:Vacuolar ATPase assembly protein VMA22 n=1 Tax=Candida viswanathii TaxID=5486 RepID=A0A367YK82_9ASCO|nr:hypothetical protein Cantr_01744 [Candida viswanathii]